jgi:hypothetical protein
LLSSTGIFFSDSKPGVTEFKPVPVTDAYREAKSFYSRETQPGNYTLVPQCEMDHFIYESDGGKAIRRNLHLHNNDVRGCYSGPLLISVPHFG